MSPLPIRKNSEETLTFAEEMKNPTIAQDFFNLFPIIEHLFGTKESNIEEKKALKDIWLHSSSIGDNIIQIGSNIDKNSLDILKTKGFLNGIGDKYQLTDRGSKLLRDAILNDEKFSITKKASKKMISKNSYDFGDYVLAKVNDSQKFGARYINIDKKIFAKKNIKPIVIEDYKISTKKLDGTEKSLSDYSDEDLIKVLHLAKKVTDNSHNIVISGSKMSTVPVHKIKDFATKVLRELNNRK